MKNATIISFSFDGKKIYMVWEKNKKCWVTPGGKIGISESLKDCAIREVEESIGHINYNLTREQKLTRRYARSLYIVKNIKKNEKITTENVKSIRPGYGLHPKYYKEILGKKILKDVEKGTALSWDIIS